MDNDTYYKWRGGRQDYKSSIAFSLDRNGFFRGANQVALKFLGYSIFELKKKRFIELCSQQDKSELEELLNNALTGLIFDYKTEIIVASGERCVLQIASVPIEFDNEIVGVHYIAIDKTTESRKIVEKALIDKISDAFSEDRNLEECLRLLLHELSNRNSEICVAEAWISNFEEDQLLLAFRYFNSQSPSIDDTTNFESGKGLIGKVHQTKEKYFISNLQHSIDFIRQAFAKANDLKSALALPVIYNYKVVAILAFYCCKEVQEESQIFEVSDDFILQLAIEIQRKKSEWELMQFFNMSPDLMCIAGMDGKFKKVNDACRRILGYEKHELINQPVVELIYSDDRAASLKELDKLKEGIPTSYFENRYCCKDGSIKYLAWTVVPDTARRLVYAVAKDVTEKKRLEKELQSEQQRFLDMFQEAPVSMAIVKSKDFIFVAANELYYKLTGRTPNIIGKNVVEVFPELENHGYLEWLNKVYYEGETFAASEALFYFDYDGTGNLQHRYLNFVYQPYRNEEGEVDGIFYTGVDVTEQVMARKKIEESEHRFRIVFEQAAVGVAIKDPKTGTVVKANAKYYEIFGLTEKEIDTVSYLKMTHPDDLQKERKLLGLLFEGEITEYNLEKRQYNKDGSIVWVSITASAMWRKGEEPTFFIAIVQDITERVKAQLDLERSESRLAYSQSVAKIGSWETDLITFDVIWSAETYRIFEMESMDLSIVHEDFLRMVHPDDRSLVEQAFKQSFATESFHSITHRIVTSNGKLKYVEQRWRIFHDEVGQPLNAIGTSQDITEQKLAQEAKEIAEQKVKVAERLLLQNQREALKELKKKKEEILNFAKHLNTVLEEERARIAREIHDEFGQQLTGLRMSLSSALKSTNKLTSDGMIRQMLASVDTTVNSLRNFANELRPIILDSLGLIPSIEWLVQQFEIKTGIVCDLFINVERRVFDKDISTAFFRICQEALTNVMKHAKAEKVWLKLFHKEDQLVLEINDNGRGFEMLTSTNPLTLGLIGMRERAKLINANLEIKSKPAGGTLISLIVKNSSLGKRSI